MVRLHWRQPHVPIVHTSSAQTSATGLSVLGVIFLCWGSSIRAGCHHSVLGVILATVPHRDASTQAGQLHTLCPEAGTGGGGGRGYPAYKGRLPPKRIFFHTTSSDFVEERRQLLDDYLQPLLGEPNLCRAHRGPLPPPHFSH